MRPKKRDRFGASMNGDEVSIALTALRLENQPHLVARIFGVETRTVWRWQVIGAAPHIALAFDELLSGRLTLRGVRPFLKRIGRSRDDGDRYRGRLKSMSASEEDDAFAE